MNKKQGKPLKMRLFFFLVTHIDGNPSEPQTGQNAKQCVGKDVAYQPAKQAEPEIRQNGV